MVVVVGVMERHGDLCVVSGGGLLVLWSEIKIEMKNSRRQKTLHNNIYKFRDSDWLIKLA